MSGKQTEQTENTEKQAEGTEYTMPEDGHFEVESAAEQKGPESSEDPEPLKARVQELETKVREYWDQVLRARAETDNTRRRAEKEIEQTRKFALEGLLEELLPVKDSLEMALQAEAGDDKASEQLRQGVRMTLDMFTEVLKKRGVEEINPGDEKFDPNYHQAMTTVQTEGEPNRVASVMQKGYILNGRLVRPAMVAVSARSDESSQDSESTGGPDDGVAE